MRERTISIWLFVGALVLIYGVLILGEALYELASPPAQRVVLWQMHAGIWWGGLLVAFGGLFVWLFAPGRGRGE